MSAGRDTPEPARVTGHAMCAELAGTRLARRTRRLQLTVGGCPIAHGDTRPSRGVLWSTTTKRLACPWATSLARAVEEEIFGSGLSNKSFNGLPIHSTWLGVYLDQGWFGVVIDAALLITLILLAMTHRRGVRRAVAVFLVVYCLVASITETGLTDASPYLLELVLATSLLAAPAKPGAT